MSLYAMTDLEIVWRWPSDYRLMRHQMQDDENTRHVSVLMSKFPRDKWSPWWAPRISGPVFALEQAVLEGMQWS